MGMFHWICSCVMPCVTPWQMKSKWRVSPWMTHPSAITASTSVYSAKNWVPSVSSNVPGTYLISMFMSGHPALRSVRTAPSSSASVMSRFHSATTIPNFMSAAEGSGESNRERLWWRVAIDSAV